MLPKISLATELDGPEDFDVEESATAGPSSSTSHQVSVPSQTRKHNDYDTKVVWHGQHYFVASKNISQAGLPSVEVFEITASSGSPQKVATVTSSGLKGKGAPGSLSITEMQLDAGGQDQQGVRLAVFYSNGQFSIFRVQGTGDAHAGALNISEEYFQSSTSSRPTIMARLHSPVLVTCTSDCSVRFRLLEELRDTLTGLTQLSISTAPPTMRTSFCFAPMTMRLTPKNMPTAGFARLKAQQAPQRFQLSLAYCTPYYPAAFTVALQVYNITVPPKSKVANAYHRRLEVFARSAIAVPPTSTIPGEQNEAMINTIEHDGPYIVASRSDNTISVYKAIDGLSDTWLSHKDTANTMAMSPARMHAIPLRLRHVRTLFGHTSAVDAVSLLDGRCVSTGRDGIKVWQLPLSNSAKASPVPSSQSEDEDDSRWRNNNISISDREVPQVEAVSNADASRSQHKCRWIGLDTSRIVTVSQGEEAEERLIKVYHFE